MLEMSLNASFSCIYVSLRIQLKQIGTQYQIIPGSELFVEVFTNTVSWLGNEELLISLHPMQYNLVVQ